MLGSALPFTQILGLFLGELKQRAEAAAGRDFEQAVLGRPVFFVDDDPAADREAADTLAQVARELGFKEVLLPVRADRRGLRLRGRTSTARSWC